ncbi:hypothetical protein CXG81DRAFT_11110, partial [Caulochytrium protostelioides]
MAAAAAASGRSPSALASNALVDAVASLSSSAAQLVGGIAAETAGYWAQRFFNRVVARSLHIDYYRHLADAAVNYEQWHAAAQMLDHLHGQDDWKADATSPLYEWRLVQDRLYQLQKARATHDIDAMLFTLRTSMTRNLGNMGNPQLYMQALTGTKRLIESYVDEVALQLEIIADSGSTPWTIDDAFDFLKNTQTAYGRTALLLSGGATFGLAHIGVVQTLLEQHLLPKIVSGSSVGSLIAAVVCTRLDDELPSFALPEHINLDVFESEAERAQPWPRLQKIVRFLRDGVVFDPAVFSAAIQDNVGMLTFQEAYNRTRRVLNITVSSSTAFEMPRMLNYLTAPNVLIWSAVVASCAIPFVYQPAVLLSKDSRASDTMWETSQLRWIDGSVEGDIPIARIAELFNVNHFIVSQVNPHVIPFLDRTGNPGPLRRATARLADVALCEVQHRCQQLKQLGLSTVAGQSLLAITSQKYIGDITIIPPFDLSDAMGLLSNPDARLFNRFCHLGRHAAWHLLPMIRNHCKVELTIDRLLNRLRA